MTILLFKEVVCQCWPNYLFESPTPVVFKIRSYYCESLPTNLEETNSNGQRSISHVFFFEIQICCYILSPLWKLTTCLHTKIIFMCSWHGRHTIHAHQLPRMIRTRVAKQLSINDFLFVCLNPKDIIASWAHHYGYGYVWILGFYIPSKTWHLLER